MDISFTADGAAFNYRVAAIIVSNDRLLVMQDEGMLTQAQYDEALQEEFLIGEIHLQ